MVFEKLIRYIGLAVGLMVFEKFIRYASLAVGLKPSATECEARLRGLERIVFSKTISRPRREGRGVAPGRLAAAGGQEGYEGYALPDPPAGGGMGKPGFPIPLRGEGVGKPGCPTPLFESLCSR
jgi:hypothetical protein